MKTAFAGVLLAICLFSCRDRDKNGKLLDSPISGQIRIVADESLRPVVEAEVEVFNGIYTRAHIDATYMSEQEAFDLLMKDSVKVAVVTRKLTDDEKKYFTDLKITVDQEEMATSGIALIVNPANDKQEISIAELRQILGGKIRKWNELGGRSNNGIEIVFDNPKSGLIRYLKDSVAKVETLPANCYAVESNQAVVDHVAQNENALGLIGVEWISDDPVTNTFLKKIKVLAVAGDSVAFEPYQAYMALKHYPLMRTITVINRETRTGLGTGFSSFFASERGQRIILKSGLVPKTMPVRIIKVNTNAFEVTK